MVILASQSPRRRELLKYIFDDFSVRPAHCDESSDAPDAQGKVLAAAVRKAQAVAQDAAPEDLIIAADTLVLCGDRILGKPRDAADATRMLTLLSGNSCSVFTGVAVSHNGQIQGLCERSEVWFYPLTSGQIADYVASGEPMDKAGSFGIQGRGALLVHRISGDFYNVMGLPVGALGQLLMGMGVL